MLFTVIKNICIGLLLIFLWQMLVWIGHYPDYILPTPIAVAKVFIQNYKLLFMHTLPTLYETFFGFIFGLIFGCAFALLIHLIKPLRAIMLPIILSSQALPIFAIAPLLVIWFGYGISSKIIIIILMIFFPITSNFYDGLQKTPQAYLDLAHIMNAKRLPKLMLIEIPAALPSLASGIKIAAVYAPMGAIIGEWSGAENGLGYLILNSNSRSQTELMFASIFCIMILSFILYALVSSILKKTIYWANHL